MGSKRYPKDVLNQATDVMTAINQIDPNFRSGSVSVTSFTDDVTQVQSIQTQIVALEKQLAGLRNQRNDRLMGLWESIKRMRTSIKGAYGDDSSEYDLVGGTRRSEYKRTPRKP